ncbi:MAG: endonuclease III domain-containing protein [Bacillota bacterium]
MLDKYKQLLKIYDKMLDFTGPRNWWPGETPFEVVVGAILTQSVAWRNVEKAINNLKSAGLLDIDALYQADTEEIAGHIIPTLYYRMKASKLKAFVTLLVEKYGSSLEQMFDQDLRQLRQELLAVYGIGPETADSIILYAAEKPVFVVDAYTKRIFHRLGIFPADIDYAGMQEFFMTHLDADVQLYNEYHAQIVGIGNRFCGNRKPACDRCPLNELCRFAKEK